MSSFPQDMIPPPVSMDTIGFWEAAREHRLVVQRCAVCVVWQHPPAPVCHACRGGDLRWEPAGVRGVLYTWTAVHKAWLPSLEAHLPYVVAVVELPGAGGTRIVSSLVGVASSGVRIGMPLVLTWQDMAGYSVPRFRPA